MPGIKLKEIAKAAGVSISTVSKALAGGSDISSKTRAEILRIARELSYVSSRVLPKRGQDSAKGSVIGVICPEIKSNYYAQLVSSISERLSDKGFRCIIAVTDFKTENELAYIRLFNSRDIGGILLISESEDIIPGIAGGDIRLGTVFCKPLLIITNSGKSDIIDCISIDDRYGVDAGIDHLAKLGHTRIGYIGDSLTDGRLKAFFDSLKKNAITADRSLIRTSEDRFEKCGYESMKSLLVSVDPPTAIFAAYDDIAVGAVKAIRENGFSVPEDISVIGMDNIMICPYLEKKLTTVSNPIKEMAEISVSILTRKITDPGFTVVQHVALKPELIVRETTASAHK